MHKCQHFPCFSSHLFFPSLSSFQWCAQKRKSSSSVHLMVSSSHKLPVTLFNHHSHAMHVQLVLITSHSMSGQGEAVGWMESHLALPKAHVPTKKWVLSKKQSPTCYYSACSLGSRLFCCRNAVMGSASWSILIGKLPCSGLNSLFWYVGVALLEVHSYHPRLFQEF